MSARNAPDVAGHAWPDLPDNCHACLIYDNPAQRDAVVRAYLETGLRQGQAVRYFTDETPEDVVRSWLPEDVLPEASDKVRIAAAVSVYCPDGEFDPHRMVEGMIPKYELARKAGFTGLRSAGEMTWALRGLPGSDRLLEYEALLNTLESDFPHLGMCQYDARRFDGATLFHVLRIHPYVVAGDRVVWNPYFDADQRAS